MTTVAQGTRRAECSELRVELVPHPPARRAWDLGDRVSVLVPDPTLRLALDARSRGHRYQGTIDGTAVSVLPPCSLEVEAHCPGAILVMAMDRRYFDERLRGSRRLMRGAPHAIDPLLHRLGRTMRDALEAQMPPTVPYLEALARDLREHLYHAYTRERRRQSVSLLGAERLAQAIEHMRAHLANKDLTVGDIAGAVGLSPFHFTRMFTTATGKAPHAYLTDLRMAEAKKLLGETCLAIAEVAQRCGYATHAHFTGVFGRHAGQTPALYRQAVRTARAAERAGAAKP